MKFFHNFKLCHFWTLRSSKLLSINYHIVQVPFSSRLCNGRVRKMQIYSVIYWYKHFTAYITFIIYELIRRALGTSLQLGPPGRWPWRRASWNGQNFGLWNISVGQPLPHSYYQKICSPFSIDIMYFLLGGDPQILILQPGSWSCQLVINKTYDEGQAFETIVSNK